MADLGSVGAYMTDLLVNQSEVFDVPTLGRDFQQDPPGCVPFGGYGVSLDDTVAPQYISGHVLDIDGIGVSRTVIAIDRASGARLGITQSDNSGAFVLHPRSLEPCIIIAVPLLDEQLNAVVLDNITPIPA